MRLILFIVITSLLAALYFFQTSKAAGRHTFDMENDKWKIDVSLTKEPKEIYHPAVAVYVDEDQKEVIVLYPFDKRGVHYKSSDVRDIRFTHKK